MVSTADIHWVAGFLEGEGSFTASHNVHGTAVTISAPQVQREPLERLQRIMGGHIYRRGSGIHLWNLTRGAVVVGWMMTLFSLMSSKRQTQIKTALDVWQEVPSTRYQCRRGHHRTMLTTYIAANGTRRCRTCKNAWQRKKATGE